MRNKSLSVGAVTFESTKFTVTLSLFCGAKGVTEVGAFVFSCGQISLVSFPFVVPVATKEAAPGTSTYF